MIVSHFSIWEMFVKVVFKKSTNSFLEFIWFSKVSEVFQSLNLEQLSKLKTLFRNPEKSET